MTPGGPLHLPPGGRHWYALGGIPTPDPETFLARVRREPTGKLARWLVKTLDKAIDEIYVADLLEDEVLSTRDLAAPSDAALKRLLREGAEQRRLHNRYARSRDLLYPT